MELREYTNIIRKNTRAFWWTLGVCLIVGGVWFLLQPVFFRGHLTLNVTRMGQQATSDYRFDDFYRLQADERFADTVVRWLETPRGVEDIYTDAKLGARPSRGFVAKRLSSQVIQVEYATATPEEARVLGESVKHVVNRMSEELNQKQQKENWFILVGGEPVITDGRQTLLFLLAVSLAFGIFLGAWAIFIRHYCSKSGSDY